MAASRKQKGKKRLVEKVKSKHDVRIPVSMMNAPPLVIREPDSSTSRSIPASITGKRTNTPKRARVFSGKNPNFADHQQNEESESDGSSQSDDSEDMVDAENEVDEMNLDDVIGSETASDIPSSSNSRVRRGYDLPKQRNAGELRKTVSIFQNILRPDDIPRWFCPEIRYRFVKFWNTFDETDNDFRDKMWEAFKQWYIVPAEINEAVHKLFLEHLASSYKNFVARMKRGALRSAKLTHASPRLIEHPPPFLNNRPSVWKGWVDYWCGEKQLKISSINSNNRKSQNGGMGTHAGGSRSHTRSSAQIVDSTSELPSIAKRLKLQYGKKDNEGNPTNEMINLTSENVLKEWRDAVKNKYGPDAEVDDNRDGDLYLTLPSVIARKKKGRLFGYGLNKYSYLSLDSNNVGTSRENISKEHNPETCRLALMVEALNNLVIKQEKRINSLVDFVTKKMACQLPDLDVDSPVLDSFFVNRVAPNVDVDATDLNAPDRVVPDADVDATDSNDPDLVAPDVDATTPPNAPDCGTPE